MDKPEIKFITWGMLEECVYSWQKFALPGSKLSNIEKSELSSSIDIRNLCSELLVADNKSYLIQLKENFKLLSIFRRVSDYHKRPDGFIAIGLMLPKNLSVSPNPKFKSELAILDAIMEEIETKFIDDMDKVIQDISSFSFNLFSENIPLRSSPFINYISNPSAGKKGILKLLKENDLQSLLNDPLHDSFQNYKFIFLTKYDFDANKNHELELISKNKFKNEKYTIQLVFKYGIKSGIKNIDNSEVQIFINNVNLKLNSFFIQPIREGDEISISLNSEVWEIEDKSQNVFFDSSSQLFSSLDQVANDTTKESNESLPVKVFTVYLKQKILNFKLIFVDEVSETSLNNVRLLIPNEENKYIEKLSTEDGAIELALIYDDLRLPLNIKKDHYHEKEIFLDWEDIINKRYPLIRLQPKRYSLSLLYISNGIPVTNLGIKVVNVNEQNNKKEVFFEGYTDDKGELLIKGLLSGEYKLTTRKKGFKKNITSVDILVNKEVSINMHKRRCIKIKKLYKLIGYSSAFIVCLALFYYFLLHKSSCPLCLIYEEKIEEVKMFLGSSDFSNEKINRSHVLLDSFELRLNDNLDLISDKEFNNYSSELDELRIRLMEVSSVKSMFLRFDKDYPLADTAALGYLFYAYFNYPFSEDRREVIKEKLPLIDFR